MAEVTPLTNHDFLRAEKSPSSKQCPNPKDLHVAPWWVGPMGTFLGKNPQKGQMVIPFFPA